MVQGKKKTSKLPSITDTVKKTLLQDVEAKGIDFEEISLVDICNQKEAIYGPPSTDRLRRSVQRRWDKIKKRHPKNYVKLLRKYDITPGPFTFHRLREVSGEEPPSEELSIVDEDEEEQISPAPSTPPSSAVKTLTFAPIVEETPEEERNLDYVTKQFDSLALSSPPRVISKPTTTTMLPTLGSPVANQTPVRKKTAFGLPASVGSPIPPMRTGTPAASTTKSNGAAAPPPAEDDPNDPWYTALDHANQEGSKILPFLIRVDTDYPERNGPCFEVEKMHEIEHNNHLHTAYHIRRSIPVPDYRSWEAFIPDPDEYPFLQPLYGRIFMIRGPSRPYWFRNAKRYHANQKKIKCEKTRQRHEKTDTAIERDPERKLHYHLFVFPVGVVLDNSIFSDNNTSIAGNQLSLGLKEDDVENVFKKTLWGMGVYWRIAEAGGTRIRNDADDIDAATLLF